jgi:hypothetical protein
MNDFIEDERIKLVQLYEIVQRMIDLASNMTSHLMINIDNLCISQDYSCNNNYDKIYVSAVFTKFIGICYNNERKIWYLLAEIV